jgi:hypothetical protein
MRIYADPDPLGSGFDPQHFKWVWYGIEIFSMNITVSLGGSHCGYETDLWTNSLKNGDNLTVYAA